MTLYCPVCMGRIRVEISFTDSEDLKCKLIIEKTKFKYSFNRVIPHRLKAIETPSGVVICIL
jgi:hypothetical protein